MRKILKTTISLTSGTLVTAQKKKPQHLKSLIHTRLQAITGFQLPQRIRMAIQQQAMQLACTQAMKHLL